VRNLVPIFDPSRSFAAVMSKRYSNDTELRPLYIWCSLVHAHLRCSYWKSPPLKPVGKLW